jgi:hypothetical protein
MSKPMSQIIADQTAGSSSNPNNEVRRSPLAELVGNHLRENKLRQVDFCRQTGFDQGLLSKILSSVVSTLNVETALRLADGMKVPPGVVFEAIGKQDIDQMLRRFYAGSDSIG